MSSCDPPNDSNLTGGWDPAWDKPPKMYLIKPKKGHLRERTRATRAAKITAAMTAMPERIQKYKQVIIIFTQALPWTRALII